MSHGVVPGDLAEGARGRMAPLATRLHRLGVSANAVTVVGFVLTVAGAALLAFAQPGPALALLVIGTLADTLDGQLARAAGGGTPFGAFLDSTLDRLSDAALAVAAAALGAYGNVALLFWAALLSLVASFMVSYVRAKAESLGLSAGVGLAPREARLVIFLLGVAAWALFDLPQLFVAAVVAVALLATLTMIQRIAHVASAANEKERLK